MQQKAMKDLQLLVFELGGGRYALDLSAVREVVRAVLISPLPDAPAVIEGVISVRGQLAAVYDLRARFGLPSAALSPEERMVIAWTGSRLVAFRCDRADRVEEVPQSRLAEASRVEGASRHVAGVARLEDGLVVIQDLTAFLDDDEVARLDSALAAHGQTPHA